MENLNGGWEFDGIKEFLLTLLHIIIVTGIDSELCMDKIIQCLGFAFK